jgi:hypothetical protein
MLQGVEFEDDPKTLKNNWWANESHDKKTGIDTIALPPKTPKPHFVG